MLIRVDYETTYAYDGPVRAAVQLLRMTPRRHDGQRIGRWRVRVEAEGRLRPFEDGFGNLANAFYLSHPADELRIVVEGEADTVDTAGVVAGAPERFPPAVFLRETPLTAPDDAIAELTRAATRASEDPVGRLHALMAGVGAAMRFDPGGTGPTTTGAQALALGHGVCQDMAHVFIAAARRLDAPARYVSGHLVRADGRIDQEAGHAWAEAHVEALGWVGFDPANGVCPTESYLRVATGLDYLSAAPVRGSRVGGGEERMDVRLRVVDAARQVQA